VLGFQLLRQFLDLLRGQAGQALLGGQASEALLGREVLVVLFGEVPAEALHGVRHDDALPLLFCRHESRSGFRA
jgi:hypothetical protein